jgi:hypothetical protein
VVCPIAAASRDERQRRPREARSLRIRHRRSRVAAPERDRFGRRGSLGPLSSDNGAVHEDNLETVRQGYEVLNRGEVDRFLTNFVHPEHEFHTGVRVPSIPTVVRSRDGLRAWIEQRHQGPWEEQLQMEWSGWSNSMTAGFSRSSRCAQVARGSGARVETEYAHITVREGLCVRAGRIAGGRCRSARFPRQHR